MEFREALKDIVTSKKLSLTSDNFDKTVLVAFSEYCSNNNDILQFQELKNILLVNANFGSALAQAYLSCKNRNDESFALLADKIEEISDELEKNNISCFSYSYFISCYLDLFKVVFNDKEFNDLKIESIKWLDPEKYDYSYQALVTSEKTFGFGRYRATIKDFKIENGVLKKYSGKDPYVVIPSFVSSIGKSAFANNKKIKSVYVPNSVNKIGAEAFSGCEKLETVVLSESIKNLLADTFRECKLLKRINLNNIASIGKRCFIGCVKLDNIDATRLTKVEDEAFSYCISLKNTDFISNLTYIGGRAFENCSMNYITLDKCVYLGTQAFFNCKAATRIALNSKIDTLGIAPFSGCVTVNLLNIGDNCYNGYVHTLFAETLHEFNLQITALNCVKKDYIKTSEFDGYSCIKEVEIRKADIIPDRAFANCKNLYCVKFNNVVRAIGQSAFAGCQELVDLSINYNGDKIPTRAFYKCRNLNVEGLLKNAEYVGDFAFAYTDLSDFDFSKKFKYIGAFAFANARFRKTLSLDLRGCKVLPGAFHGAQEISTLRIDSLNSLYKEKLYLLFDPIVPEFVEKTKIHSIIIDGTIVKEAFKDCSNISSVEFSVNNGNIPYEAFENCSSLTMVKINGKVSKIEDYAFSDCAALLNLDMKYESISVGCSAFYGCKNVSSMVDISKVTSFGNFSFANTDIKSLNLNENVEYIGKAAFSGCTYIQELVLPFIGCAPKNSEFGTQEFGAIFGTVSTPNSIVQHVQCGEKSIDYYIPKNIKRVKVLSKSLSDNCFDGCNFLGEISLPNIVDFDKNYFRGCSNLQSVVLGASLKKFSAKSIAGANSKVKFNIDGKCQAYVSTNGTVMTRDRKKLCFLGEGDNLSKYISKVSSIGEYAVLHSTKTIEIPNTVNEIESYAFNCEDVKSISIDSVENVMSCAFYNCGAMEELAVKNTELFNTFEVNNQQVNFKELVLQNVTAKNMSNIFLNAENIVIDKLKLLDISISSGDFLDKVSSVKTIELNSNISRAFDETANNTVAYKLMCEHHYLISDLLREDMGVKTLIFKSAKIRPNEFSGLILDKLVLENISIIHKGAFENATIKNFTLNNVEKIEAGAFTDSNIEQVSITDKKYNLVDGVLLCDGELIYYFNKGLQNIIIPKFVTHVCEGAIDCLLNLSQISISHSDIVFDTGAIHNCRNLSNIDTVEIKNKTLRELFDEVSSITYIKYTGNTVKTKFLSKLSAVRDIDLVGVSKLEALAFFGDTSLEKVEGLNEIVSVGDMAFANCSAIKTVMLPNSCIRLGLAAFLNCVSLRNVSYSIDVYQVMFNITAMDIFGEKINPSLKVEITCADIPTGYFENFDANIVVLSSPKTIGDRAFKNSGLTLISLSEAEKIGEEAFSSSKIKFAQPLRASYIGNNAFYNCTQVRFAEFPFLGNDIDHPTTLERIFGDLSKLNISEIKIFSGNIADGAFENCIKLVSVVMPRGLQTIPSKCFSGCSKLEKIVNAESAKNIGEKAFFNCSSIKRMELCDVEVIADGAFWGCANITEILLSQKIKRMGKNILHGCESISTLKLSFTREINIIAALGDGVEKNLREINVYGEFLGEKAFENCSNLEKAELSDLIRVIPAYTFANCEKLKKVTGATGVIEICRNAFCNCFALSKLEILKNIKVIGKQAFANSGLAGECDLNGVYEIGEFAFSKTQIKSVRLGDKLKAIKSHTFEKCELLENVDIDISVKTIEDHAFVSCKALSSISLQSVVSIGEQAFSHCESLIQVSLVSLEKMGVRSFEKCISLQNAVLGDNLLVIPERAFSDCDKLSLINIPTNLTEIGNRAFASTQMKKVKLKMPSSLVNVGECIFENAYSPIVYANPSQVSKWNSKWDANCKGRGLFNLSKKVIVKKI